MAKISKIKLNNTFYDLSDPAISSWAKASTKPSYTLDEVSDGTNKKWNDKVGQTISKTWAELKAMRDGGTLVPGQWYRITDYVTQCYANNARSAGHQFDIIVRADDVNVLNENAYAAKHAGDTYFSSSNLAAWELKYSLDSKYWGLQHGEPESAVLQNLNTRVTYVGSETKWGNTFYKWSGTFPWGGSYVWSDRVEKGAAVYYDFNGTKNNSGCPLGSITYAQTSSVNGTITYMKDEAGNECHYDFKNIQFKFQSSDATSGIVANVYYYTFSAVSGTNDATVTDYSLSTSVCYNNKIKERYNDGLTLNFIVFRNSGTLFNCYNNTFGVGCYNNTFNIGCSNNTFGVGCYNNTFGILCSHNTFGYNCNTNAFRDYCTDNEFGYDCNHNIFETSCSHNTFGYDCNTNAFGNYCSNNTFGDDCHSNTLGSNCYNNILVANCHSNTFGSNCNNNTFGAACSSNTFGSNCNTNTFGSNCHFNRFGTSSVAKNYCQNIIIENGNKYIYLDCSATTSSSACFQNVKIAQGVNDTSTYKTITHTTAGDTFQTIYKPVNSVEVSV